MMTAHTLPGDWMLGQTRLPDPRRALVYGPPADQEPGIGALTIPGYLKEVCERYDDAEALVIHRSDGVQRLSYRALYAASMRVARALAAAGVGKDTRVGILMCNRPEYIAAVFGIAMAGGVAVALSTFSTEPELAHLLAASDLSILLFEERVLSKDFGAMLSALMPEVQDASVETLRSSAFPFLRRLVWLDAVTAAGEAGAVQALTGVQAWDDFLSGAEGVDTAVIEARAASVAAADIGGIFFSSGTTSQPKGIVHTQRTFALQWWRWPQVLAFREPARAWTGNGFFWSGNISMIVGSALSSGGAIVLQPLFEAEQALSLIAGERVNFMMGRPHQWARMQAAPNWEQVDLQHVKYVTKGDIIHQHPTVNTDWEVPMAFGTTETMTMSTSLGADAGAVAYADSFGVPTPGNVLKIVDPVSGELVAPGERGELCLKGTTLMLGYLGRTREECFDEDGFYCTGDGGYVDQAGRLYWEGRLNDIIKTGGANVSPEEVDTVIAGCPGVKRVATIGLPHETLGEIVVSCIVPLADAALDQAAVLAFLKPRLASYKCPRELVFLQEHEIPLTANEKIKTAELKQQVAARLGVGTAANLEKS